MIAPSGNGSVPSRYALIDISLPRMARISLSLPSSWATEINFQSRYPGGMLITKIEGELAAPEPGVGGLLVFASTAFAIVAAVLSLGSKLVFCASDFCLMMTTE